MATFKDGFSNNFLQRFDSPKSLKPLKKITLIKLQAIVRESPPYNNHIHPIKQICPRPIEGNSMKMQHSRSNYIKKIECSPNQVPSQSKDYLKRQIESAIQGRYQKQDIEKNYYNNDRKGRQSKSFVIRKKNISDYNSRRCNSVKKGVGLQSQVGRYSKQICNISKPKIQRVSRRQVNFISEPCQIQSANKKVYRQCPLPARSLNRKRSDVKINPIVAVDRQQHIFLQQHSGSSKLWKADIPLPNYEKPAQHSKNIHRILRKIRIASKSSMQRIKTSQKQQTKANQTQPLQQILNNKIETEKPSLQKQKMNKKRRVHSGCKTIRVPWQPSQAGSINQIQNRPTKKSVKEPEIDFAAQQMNLNQDAFGGISIISAKKTEGLVKSSSVPTQSLKQIYDQLKTIESVQGTVSKQLI